MDHLRVDPNTFQIPGMHAPPLTNQPPQIFGSYGLPDGLPMLPPELQMFDPSALLGDDQDAKRRRIARVSERLAAPGFLSTCAVALGYQVCIG